MEHGKDIGSAQIATDYRKHPIDDHGKLRYAYAKVTADGALAADGTMALFYLPPGRKRILPHLSRITTSAFGAGRTLDLGHAAYTKSAPSTQEDEDVDALIDGLDVSSAVTADPVGTSLKFDMYSTDEVLVFATVLGGTMPDAGTVEVLLAYLYE